MRNFTLAGAGIFVVDRARIHDGDASCLVVRHEKIVDGKPISFYAVHHLDQLQGTPTEPITSRSAVECRASLITRLRYPPMVFDPYNAADFGAESERQLGYKQVDEPEKLAPRRYFVLPMDPARQTERWLHLKSAIQGGRLFVPDTPFGREAMAQAADLRATQLPSGALRVDGKRDDLIEVIKEGCWYSRYTPAVDDGDGVVTYEGGGWGTYEHGTQTLSFDGGYVRTMPDGRRVPIEPPLGSRHVVAYCRDRIYRGEFTERVFEWLRAIFDREPTQDDVQRVRDGEFNDR